MDKGVAIGGMVQRLGVAANMIRRRPNRERAAICVIALLSTGLTLLTPEAYGVQAQDASVINCKDFIDQEEAQRFFIAKGGPTYDPYYLDGDGDGIACEPGPAPTPVSAEHAEYCEEYEAAASEYGAPGSPRCADWREQTLGYQRCPAYEGLPYIYFSRLNRSQVSKLTDRQKSEYDDLMSMAEGDCVAVDVAKTTAWECQPFPFYLSEYQRSWRIPISDYYRDQLNERYQVVCMGAPIKVGGRFSTTQKWVVGAVAAGAVYLYLRHRQSESEGADV